MLLLTLPGSSPVFRRVPDGVGASISVALYASPRSPDCIIHALAWSGVQSLRIPSRSFDETSRPFLLIARTVHIVTPQP